MESLMSAWTDRHTRVALLVAAAVVAAAAGAIEEPPVTVWVAVAVALTASLALVLDAFGGLAVGFVVAALLVGVRRAAGDWGPGAFVLALVETVAILATAVAAARVGTAFRREDESGREPEAPAVEPVFGSLGLLEADTGMLRLEEEVQRARDHGRPLTLVLLQVEDDDEGLDAAERTAAHRAVARLLESRVRDTDVPFALARDRLAAILPETDASAGLERVGAILDGVANGRFASRSQGSDRALADAVTVTVGTARLGGQVTTADGLLDAATIALDRARATSTEGQGR